MKGLLFLTPQWGSSFVVGRHPTLLLGRPNLNCLSLCVEIDEIKLLFFISASLGALSFFSEVLVIRYY